MKLLKHIKQGEMIPAWHGVAYFDFQRLEAVVAPLPINVLIAFARAIYTTLRFAHRSVADSQRAAYAQGFKDGAASMRNTLTALNEYEDEV